MPEQSSGLTGSQARADHRTYACYSLVHPRATARRRWRTSPSYAAPSPRPPPLPVHPVSPSTPSPRPPHLLILATWQPSQTADIGTPDASYSVPPCRVLVRRPVQTGTSHAFSFRTPLLSYSG